MRHLLTYFTGGFQVHFFGVVCFAPFLLFANLLFQSKKLLDLLLSSCMESLNELG